jgi:hypothetical protein
MSRRRIGQETFGFGGGRERQSSLDELARLIDWSLVERRLVDISSSAKVERAWPPLALFKALLLSVWYDLSDVKLAEALDDLSQIFLNRRVLARWSPLVGRRRIAGAISVIWRNADIRLS